MFRLLEAGGPLLKVSLFSGRQRSQALRAASAEECMDWTCSVREVIAGCAPPR